MGLDIRYYSGLVPAVDPARYEDGTLEDYDLFEVRSVEDDFPGRIDGLEDGAAYTHADTGHFYAGSYGRYNTWRAKLCMLAFGVAPDAVWNNEIQTGPFLELINFSDCEGVIGPIVSAKLYQDFVDNRNRILSQLHGGFDDSNFAAMYDEWLAAFKMAKDNGAVDFH